MKKLTSLLCFALLAPAFLLAACGDSCEKNCCKEKCGSKKEQTVINQGGCCGVDKDKDKDKDKEGEEDAK